MSADAEVQCVRCGECHHASHLICEFSGACLATCPCEPSTELSEADEPMHCPLCEPCTGEDLREAREREREYERDVYYDIDRTRGQR